MFWFQCSLGEGDCDYTFECMEGSFCGYNNCDLTKPWHTAHDDCCASVVPDKQCSPPVDDCCKDKTDGQKVRKKSNILSVYFLTNHVIKLVRIK